MSRTSLPLAYDRSIDAGRAADDRGPPRLSPARRVATAIAFGLSQLTAFWNSLQPPAILR